MLRLAITGGLASGKSTVAELLRQRGIPVVDADALGHEILQGEARDEVIAVFGPRIVENGRISPTRLAARVFAPGADAELAKLNRILHPRIMAAATRQLDEHEQQGREVAAVEAALLIEAGLLAGFDRVVLVTAPMDQRIERFIRRTGADRAGAPGVPGPVERQAGRLASARRPTAQPCGVPRQSMADSAAAVGRMAQQWPDEHKRPHAHFVIENSGTLAQLAVRVDAMLRQLRKEIPNS